MTVSKEHYLSNAKPCDGKIANDFGTWLEDVSRMSTVSSKDPESVSLATSRVSLHKDIRELHSAGKIGQSWKPYHKKDSLNVETPLWLSTDLLH